MTHTEAGRRGASITHARYGRDFYAACGRKGGRPRALTLSDLPAPQRVNNVEGGKLPGSVSACLRSIRQNLLQMEGGSESAVMTGAQQVIKVG